MPYTIDSLSHAGEWLLQQTLVRDTMQAIQSEATYIRAAQVNAQWEADRERRLLEGNASGEHFPVANILKARRNMFAWIESASDHQRSLRNLYAKLEHVCRFYMESL